MKKVVAILLIAFAAGLAIASSTYEVNSAQAYGGMCVDAASKLTYAVPTGSSDTYDLADNYAPWTIFCRGTQCFITCDDGTPTATTAAAGYSFSIPDGGHYGPVRFGVDKCAYIGAASGGKIEFVRGGIRCP